MGRSAVDDMNNKTNNALKQLMQKNHFGHYFRCL